MSNNDKGVQKVTPSSVPAAPSFVNRGKEAAGHERLAQFVVPPMLKIVQKQSDDQLLDAYGKGTTLLTPANVVVATVGKPFYFVPLIQYPEYLTWAPIELKGQVPAILDRSTDPASDLAKKARDRDRWFEYDFKFEDRVIGRKGDAGASGKPVRHVEHITFIVAILGDFGIMPSVMSFAKGQHKYGRNFASLLQMRNADIYGCIFEAFVPEKPEENDQGTWHVWNVRNPSEGAPYGPWVDNEAIYQDLADQAKKLEKAYQDNLLRPDYEQDDTGRQEARTDM